MATQLSPRYDIRFQPDGLPQVEPDSGFWLRCPPLRVPSLEEVRAELQRVPPGEDSFPPTIADEQKEFIELQSFYKSNVSNKPPPASTSLFLSDPLFFRRPPAGAVLSPASPGGPLTGPELASLFENETPGLWHRHVVNVFLDPELGPRSAAAALSPPRQALIWAALDVAILASLTAAWNYKWIAAGLPQIDYRRRPAEYARAQQIDPKVFQVLYDLERTTRDGRIFRDPARRRGTPACQPPGCTPLFPGTPRHPAYPSGHSTYSAAASHVLGCLFRGHEDPRLPGKPALETEFTKLATDIGVARLHGGVHWRQDHVFGQAVGNAVGRLVIAQLNATGIPVPSRPVSDPPDAVELERAATQFAIRCGEVQSDFCGAVAKETQRAMVLQNVPLDALSAKEARSAPEKNVRKTAKSPRRKK